MKREEIEEGLVIISMATLGLSIVCAFIAFGLGAYFKTGCFVVIALVCVLGALTFSIQPKPKDEDV